MLENGQILCEISLIASKGVAHIGSKKNRVPFKGRYFRPCRIRIWARKVPELLELFTTSKILFLPKNRISPLAHTKNSFFTRKSSYRRNFLRRFRIRPQKNPSSPESQNILEKPISIFTSRRQFFAPSEGEIWSN